MQDAVYDYVIVGAGLTGLNLSRELNIHQPALNTIVLEKSKSCGGRMATRRIGDFKFDHGAQFIKTSDVSEKLIQFWNEADVLQKFDSAHTPAWCGNLGMTQLAKKLVENISVKYNFKVSEIGYQFGCWVVTDENNEKIRSKNIVLTCPLPQSLELLQKAQIKFDDQLSKISYSKAIVVLVELKSDFPKSIPYTENYDQEIFSVCSQTVKGFSSARQPTYTIVLSESWSEKHFNLTDIEILEHSKNLLKTKFPSIEINTIEIKKWRYCQPQIVHKEFFNSPAKRLYLAGDAFGGASLNGALRSSSELFKYIKNHE